MWWKRNWGKLTALGGGLAGATTAVIIGLTFSGSTPERPLLSGFKLDSKNYLNCHAQGWLTCPNAATKCYRWKMQETSGDITDDLSGDSAVLADAGTPNYALHTPIPMSDGFTREAIAGNDALDEFSGAITIGGANKVIGSPVTMLYPTTLRSHSA